jgi:type I restriction enzyme S subunit
MRDGWVETTLGAVALLNPKEPALSKSDHFAPMAAVHAGKRWLQFTEERRERNGARARAGDILFARITPCLENGKVAQVQPDIDRCGGSTEFIVIRGTEKCLSDFLYFWCTLEMNRDKAAEMMIGTTGRQRLSWQNLGSLALSLPPLPEQKRIVDLITAVDLYREALQQKLEVIKKSRSAVLNDLLRAGGDGWKSVSVTDVSAMIKRGQAPSYTDAKSITVVNQKCVRNGRLNLELSRQTDVKRKPVKEWAYLSENDTLVNSTGVGTLGRTCFVGKLSEPTTVDSHITIVRPNPEKIVPGFLGLSLNFKEHEIEGLAAGSSGQTELSREDLGNLIITAPPVIEQERIVNIVASIDGTISKLEQAVDESKNLRSSLLSDLLSGRHEIPSSYDKVMEPLL